MSKVFLLQMLTLGLFAQSAPLSVPRVEGAANGPQYDVVSIRPMGLAPIEAQSLPDRLHIVMGLQDLVGYVTGTRPEFVFGSPEWSRTLRFEIIATVSEADLPDYKNLDFEQRGLMLQDAVTERFGLKVHKEIRTLPVYELVVVRSGSKLISGYRPDYGPRGSMGLAGTALDGSGVEMAKFAKVISRYLFDDVGRPVLDKTGLKGTYSFLMRWSDPVGTPNVKGSGGDQQSYPADDVYPSFSLAMEEQLGLKLQPAKDPVDVIVIDSAHPPTKN